MDLVNVRAIDLVLKLLNELSAFNVKGRWVDLFVTASSSVVFLGFESSCSATFLIELAVAAFSLDDGLRLQILVALALCGRLACSAFLIILEEQTGKSALSL